MQVREERCRRSRRRAAVIVQGVIFGSAVGLGVAALAIDTGLMYSAKQELQSAADAAALAGASQLGVTEGSPTEAAVQEAVDFAAANKISGLSASLEVESDIVFGHAVLNGEKFEFQPDVLPYDAVRVTLRRDTTVADGPVSLLFAKAMGMEGANLHASATAMLVPRDIAVVIDLSGSMNDDSELRHYKDFPSESGGTQDGVQINLKDVWCALPILKGNAGVGNGLDPPPPGNPHSENDQPGTGPGSPANAGGNPDPGADPGEGWARGPRWGWMTGWGEPIVLDEYTPVGDSGLYRIPRYSTCTDADVVENLTTAGYTANERAALLSSAYDYHPTYYKNRTMVCLGLAGWKSKMKIGTTRDSKYNGGPGNGDSRVDSNELCQEVDYQFDGGSWNDYLGYVIGYSEMTSTDLNFQYRYGLKTFTNYLLEKHSSNNQCPELADAPEEPLHSVKSAVQAMVDVIVGLETQDHLSLEAFAQYGYHLHDLVEPDSPELLADALQEIPDTLNGYQAGHYTSVTNIGAGFQEAIEELTSERVRTSAAKVIILLTDGKPNVNQWGNYVGNDNPQAISWAEDSAAEAKALGMTVYSIGVGADVNEELCLEIASSVDNYFFADNTPDPENGGRPMYVTDLEQIFQTLGGRRPVRLIQ
ncbi:MAG: VWA domain-containing protein [Phycisphaerae bacterium]|nr:VWA domain-containing protein [Phycisphaerae bacterium]